MYCKSLSTIMLCYANCKRTIQIGVVGNHVELQKSTARVQIHFWNDLKYAEWFHPAQLDIISFMKCVSYSKRKSLSSPKKVTKGLLWHS